MSFAAPVPAVPEGLPVVPERGKSLAVLTTDRAVHRHVCVVQVETVPLATSR